MKRIIFSFLLIIGVSLYGANGHDTDAAIHGAKERVDKLVGAVDALAIFARQHPELDAEVAMASQMRRRNIARQRSPKLGRAVQQSVSHALQDLLQERSLLEEVVAQKEQDLVSYMQGQAPEVESAVAAYMNQLLTE